MGAGVDLYGCEYLGGCPMIGTRVLNKVELHFDSDGLTVAIAPQGLFTLAASRPVLALAWPEITALSATKARPPLPRISSLVRAVLNVSTMRLDLPDQLAIATSAWTMTFGVRVAAAELNTTLQVLLASCGGPALAIRANSDGGFR
ncbi:MAG: hypothetical protein NVSMB12_14470 [Acidimicrobiales bacterium]